MLKGKNIAEFCFTIKFSICFLGQAEATHIEQRLLQYHRPSVYKGPCPERKGKKKNIIYVKLYQRNTYSAVSLSTLKTDQHFIS